MSTTLIFNNQSIAKNAIQDANSAEGLAKNGTNNLFTIQEHPEKKDSKVAVYVPDIFKNRSWYPDFKDKADEVVEKLSDDWFEEV